MWHYITISRWNFDISDLFGAQIKDWDQCTRAVVQYVVSHGVGLKQLDGHLCTSISYIYTYIYMSYIYMMCGILTTTEPFGLAYLRRSDAPMAFPWLPWRPGKRGSIRCSPYGATSYIEACTGFEFREILRSTGWFCPNSGVNPRKSPIFRPKSKLGKGDSLSKRSQGKFDLQLEVMQNIQLEIDG